MDKMYKQLKNLSLHEQIEYLTKELVKIKSYSGTNGEREKTEFLYKLITKFPYFQMNPKNVWIQQLEKGKRLNVFAFVEAKTKSSKTIIFHAHVDTVGIEDFGHIKDLAHDSEALEAYFAQYEGDQEVQQDALSKEWVFGRGALDMQSGISIHLANLLHYSSLEELDGNILVLFNADEENQHIGIRGALNELLRLKTEKDLKYIGAINNDFISPLYQGDTTKYIYCGGAGKLLPSFSIFGREAHVGESLAGLDPTLIASEINRRINQNFSLAESLDEELVLPPSCLYMKENKNSYNVQTPVSVRMYFNYFIYQSTPRKILEKLKEIAIQSCQQIEAEIMRNYTAYQKANKLPARSLEWKTEVLTLEEYMDKLNKKHLDPEKIIKSILDNGNNEHKDDRLIAFEIVEALQILDPEKKPRVIIFYAPPYLPSNTLQNDSTSLRLKEMVAEVLKQSEKQFKEHFSLRGYFPYLCDGSFLAFHGDKREIETVKNNFPGMDTLFPIALETMKELNIPAFNIGVYGKDGHKWTERVYKPYSFHVLPLLIRAVTDKLLADFEVDE